MEYMKHGIIIILAVIILSINSLIIEDPRLYVDEFGHYDRITRFTQGDIQLRIPSYTLAPGYHFLLAVIAEISNNTSVVFIRSVTFIISLISILIFYLTARKIDKSPLTIKTLQYCFFPILFPFFSLIYTDILSLLLVMFAFYCSLQKRYTFAGFIGIASMIVRQNNVIWLLFLFLFIYLQEYGYSWNKESIKNHLKKSWIFILGFLAFLAFVILNKGVALGDKAMHPSFSIHWGNIYLILFLFFFLFLHLNLNNLPKIIQQIKENKKIIIVMIGILIVYLFTFKNIHPYNQDYFFLRNQILLYFTSTVFLKILFFLPIAYTILSLSVTQLHEKSYYLIYPATFFYLLPSWLIEPRYYFIPFVLFMLCRKRKSKFVEYSSIIMYILISLSLFYGIFMGMFFL